MAACESPALESPAFGTSAVGSPGLGGTINLFSPFNCLRSLAMALLLFRAALYRAISPVLVDILSLAVFGFNETHKSVREVVTWHRYTEVERDLVSSVVT